MRFRLYLANQIAYIFRSNDKLAYNLTIKMIWRSPAISLSSIHEFVAEWLRCWAWELITTPGDEELWELVSASAIDFLLYIHIYNQRSQRVKSFKIDVSHIINANQIKRLCCSSRRRWYITPFIHAPSQQWSRWWSNVLST